MSIEAKEVERIVEGLTRSEQIVIQTGITYSGAQRNRLIDRGIVEESARGARQMPKKHYENSRYALPLTPLGLAVGSHLMKGQNHD